MSNVDDIENKKMKEFFKEKLKKFRQKNLEQDRQKLILEIKKIMMHKYKEMVVNSLALEKLDFEDQFVRIMKNSNKLYDLMTSKPQDYIPGKVGPGNKGSQDV